MAKDDLKSTPLTEIHILLGARMVPFAGYSMPIQYSGLKAEHNAVRNAAGLFDVCHMGEIRITGASAASFVNRIVTNDLDRIVVGQAMYTCACRKSGGIVDDLIVYKHGEKDIVIVCNASNREKFLMHLKDQAEGALDLTLADESENTSLIALQGPRALEILADAEPSLAGLASELRPFRFYSRTVAGKEVTLARTGYTGEDGVEIFCDAADSPAIWNTLLASGKPKGLLPAGLGCRDTLRLEARLSLYGQELDEQTNPIEAGLAWTVKLDKADFLGRDALLEATNGGLKRKLIGFEMIGRGSARAGYPILSKEGKAVGACTSGGPSPTLGTAIGLGYVPLEFGEIGTELLVDCRGKPVAAKVVKTPFYRRG